MTKYNGHKNYNYWNVSLWIGNDEGLYNLARDHIRRALTRREAAQNFVRDLNETGIHKTPDGAPYTMSAVQAAMSGL